MPSQPSFCTPGRPPRNLSVTSLPSPTLRNWRPGMRSVCVRSVGALSGSAGRPSMRARTRAVSTSWILPRLWASRLTSSQLPSQSTMRHEARLSTRRAPEHRLLAAGIHRDVAADAGRICRRRIDGEHQFALFRRGRYAPRHHARARRRSWARARSVRAAPGSRWFRRRSSFSVLITAESGCQRNRAAGVAGAAAARDDGEPELDAAAHQVRDLRFACRASAPRRDTPRASRSRR